MYVFTANDYYFTVNIVYVQIRQYGEIRRYPCKLTWLPVGNEKKKNNILVRQ